MSVAEIQEVKSSLIAWIEDLSDMNLLTALDSLRNTDNKKDWWDDLSENQQKVLNERLANIENTDFHSSEVFWQRVKNG
jgi:RNA polymerase-binding transcription factor DksA